MRLNARAANVRKWLAFGPVPLMDLARDMGCSRFALRHTLNTMPDISVTYGARRRDAVVALRTGPRQDRAA